MIANSFHFIWFDNRVPEAIRLESRASIFNFVLNELLCEIPISILIEKGNNICAR